jgi:hypothetical protein
MISLSAAQHIASESEIVVKAHLLVRDLLAKLREKGLAGLHLSFLDFEIGMNANGVVKGTHHELLIC